MIKCEQQCSEYPGSAKIPFEMDTLHDDFRSQFLVFQGTFPSSNDLTMRRIPAFTVVIGIRNTEQKNGICDHKVFMELFVANNYWEKQANKRKCIICQNFIPVANIPNPG